MIPKLSVPSLDEGTDGDGFPSSFSFQTRGADFAKYIKEFPYTVISSKISSALQILMNGGCSCVGVIGFCWGGWLLCHLFGDSNVSSQVLAGVICPHPTITLEEGVYGGSNVTLCSKIQRPICLMPAGNDPDLYREGGDIFKAMQDSQPLSTTISFPEMVHGWVPRGDIKNELVNRDVNLALTEANNFFTKILTL